MSIIFIMREGSYLLLLSVKPKSTCSRNLDKIADSLYLHRGKEPSGDLKEACSCRFMNNKSLRKLRGFWWMKN
ncbi:hypothetical protein Bca4012_055231 [Brassica carinata]